MSIDVKETFRRILAANTTLSTACGGRIYHSRIPEHVYRLLADGSAGAWESADWERVPSVVWIADAASESDPTGPDVDATVEIDAIAATHEAALTLAGLVTAALEATAIQSAEAPNGVFVAHIVEASPPETGTDPETLIRRASVSYRTLLIE